MTASWTEEPNRDPAGVDLPAPGRPPEAADGTPAVFSPRTVIRGESSDTGTPQDGGKVFGAFVDFINVTFHLPEARDPAADIFARLTHAIGPCFGSMENLGRGLHGYRRSFLFERGGVRFAYGGQSETGFLSIPGEGCALVSDWVRLLGLLRDKLSGRITRLDPAVDDFEGVHSVDGAVAAYRAGEFNAGGRKPKCSQAGNWIDPDGTGRTLYVGTRRNGKLLRVYEKGKQLGDASSPWVRWELEFHNVDRVIPWEAVTDPAPYLAGAFPGLSWVCGYGSRIKTVQRSDAISYAHLVRHARQSCGALINVMVDREGGADQAVEKLRRAAAPKRLAVSEYLRASGSEGAE